MNVYVYFIYEYVCVCVCVCIDRVFVYLFVLLIESLEYENSRQCVRVSVVFVKDFVGVCSFVFLGVWAFVFGVRFLQVVVIIVEFFMGFYGVGRGLLFVCRRLDAGQDFII